MRYFKLVLLSLLPLCFLHGGISVGGRDFDRSTVELGTKGEWVLYEKGAPQNEATRRWLTKRVLVELVPNEDVDFARLAGVEKTSVHGNYTVIELDGKADVALETASKLREMPEIRSAEPMLARQLYRRFTPNDPLYAYDASEPGYQWHLNNTGEGGATAGIDLNLTEAWDQYDGSGVRIAIVDDGLELGHPDLAANVDLVNDYDFNDNDEDPSPGAGDSHGTACAGVAAAVGNNGLGVSGAAPAATLVGIRLIAAPTTDQDEADAFTLNQSIIDVKSNSWGPFDNAYGEGGPGILSSLALEAAATAGRGGKGTVFLWAAGNGNSAGDDSNYDGWANSPYAIAVSAIQDTGEQANYSEPGANILVCAPSGGGTQAITTTDVTGDAGYNVGSTGDFEDDDYTNSFGGTSAATPAVAGVVALMLEANPALTYRDVQEILVRTARVNDSFNGNWVTNGAGFHFNINYGAGLVDATAATTLASTWTNLAPRQTHALHMEAINELIPDGDSAGLSKTFTVSAADSLRLEHVTVHLQSSHGNRGDLEWRLVSPSGVNVRLARSRVNDTSVDLDWTFMSTHFWGEHSEGDWTLQVIDRSIIHEGSLESATLTFYGTEIAGGLPLPVITSRLYVSLAEGIEASYQATASNLTTSYTAGGLPTGITMNATTGELSGSTDAAGFYFGSLSATNATGTTTESVIFDVLAADPALSTAVEQAATTKIVPFGFSAWFLQTSTAFDAVDAAQSGDVNDGEYSGIEFTVDGPAQITFQWKVSSEENYDYLVFAIDGVVQGFISGEVDWTEMTAYATSGTHLVDIYYLKDEFVSSGEDAGWVDQLVITPITTKPELSEATVVAYENVFFSQQLVATNATTSFTSSALPSGVTLHSSGLLYGSIMTQGSYPITVTASNLFGSDSETITIEVGSLSAGLAEALDASSQTILSTGDVTWIPQERYSNDGVDAARSGLVDNEEESVMATEIVGPCKIAFYWGVSSESDYDFLQFYIDDVLQASISGEVGWTYQSYILGVGTHHVKWRYIKDQFVFSGLDSGFVDQFNVYLDSDEDGFFADEEAYFGTSDFVRASLPVPSIRHSNARVEIEFPSVDGNEYEIEYSDDLDEWTPITVTAEGASTTWTDPESPAPNKRFYRVLIP